MAERRMFTKKITDDENFLSLSSSAQALYFHLSMSADDDGFSNQISVSMFKAHASVQDLEALLSLRYIYQFENGVIVIKHWRMANALRKDRYTPTAFQEELKQLEIKTNGAYTKKKSELVADWLPSGCQAVATDKDREDKESIEEIKDGAKAPKHPSLLEVQAYCEERGSSVDPVQFYEYFNTPDDKGRTWMDSKGKPVKNWKQKIITWEKFDGGRKTNGLQRDTQPSASGYEISYD